MSFLKLLRSVAMVSIFSSGLILSASFLFSLWMSKEDFGEYTYWYGMYLILLNVIQFGGAGAAGVFRYKEEYINYQVIMASTLYIVMPLALCLVYVLLIIFNALGKLSGSNLLIWAVPLASYFYSNFLVLVAIYRVEQNIKKYSLLFIFSSMLLFMAQVYSLYVYRDFYHVVMAFLIALSSIFICTVVLLTYDKKISLRHLRGGKEGLVDRFRYGFPIVLSSASMSFLSMADRFYLKDKIGDQEYGVYSTVVLVCSVVLFLANNFAMAWGGYLMKNVFSMNADEVLVLFYRGQRMVIPIFLVGIFVILPAIFFLHRLLYGTVEREFEISLVAIFLAYFLYGISKYYIGYMLTYKKNTGVLMSTLVGGGGVFVIFTLNNSDFLFFAPIALFLGFFIQLIYVYSYVNFKLMREL